jgi:FeS assembly SUF system regulator
MLRISKLADYGTVVMAYLAQKEPILCSAREIATQTHLSFPTVSKLLKRLTAANLLVSVRGVNGGYRLQRPPSDITVAQIIYALDEQRGLTECSMSNNYCALKRVCHIQNNWQFISQAVESALDSISLKALTSSISLPVFEKNIKHYFDAIVRT